MKIKSGFLVTILLFVSAFSVHAEIVSKEVNYSIAQIECVAKQ